MSWKLLQILDIGIFAYIGSRNPLYLEISNTNYQTKCYLTQTSSWEPFSQYHFHHLQRLAMFWTTLHLVQTETEDLPDHWDFQSPFLLEAQEVEEGGLLHFPSGFHLSIYHQPRKITTEYPLLTTSILHLMHQDFALV